MKTRYLIIGGVIIVGGGVALSLTAPRRHSTATQHSKQPVAHHPKSKPAPKTKEPTKAPPIPKNYPTIPVTGTASGSATVSFQSVVGQKPPASLQIVTLPWATGTQWALEPLGMKMHGNSLATLWFGEHPETGRWTWIPTTLPGQPSSQLPPAIREALVMAYSLHEGMSGPSGTVGNITWQGLQGKVNNPGGWTLTTASANASPLFQPTVGLTLYQQSYTGSYSGYYGMEAAFDSQNAASGLHGLVGFVANSGSLATIVHVPPRLL
ncbi:MAG: hypothetical protein M0Z36_02660 [Thermaerobacter sp.]|nr:hypothetical protein [Thermaerobacter sp.]